MTATILVPTTGDRGPLLPHSVGSALAQSVTDIEVLIIGDGVDRATAEIAEQLVAADARVRFFDFPKGARRGEPNRDRVLREHARGEIVCYLTDRGLYLPDHVAEMTRVLADADLGHTLRVSVEESGELHVRRTVDLRQPADRARHDEVRQLLPLSFAGHTMAAYRRLPEGWRVTPPGWHTDRWMWRQFLDQPWCTVGSSPVPTVLYFKRGTHHRGWSTAQRLELLQTWSERMATEGFVEEFARSAHDALVGAHAQVVRERDALLARSARRRAGRVVRRLLPAPASERLLDLGRRVLGRGSGSGPGGA